MPAFSYGKRKIYSAFGFLLESEIELPGLISANETTEPDVRIFFGEVPECVLSPLDRTDWHEYSAHEAILSAYKDIQFYIRDGKTIIIKADEGVPADKITALLLDFPFAVLLLQRSFFVLHGSCAIINGQVVAFLGRSGEGKSALVHEIWRRGGTVLADDLCAIQFENEIPMIYPGIYRLAVWHDAISADAETDTLYRPVREGIGKYFIDFSGESTCEPIRLDQIYFISEGNGERILFEEVKGYDKLKQLIHSFLHREIAEKMLGNEALFRMCARTLNSVSVGAIRKNSDLMTVSEYADFVITELSK